MGHLYVYCGFICFYGPLYTCTVDSFVFMGHYIRVLRIHLFLWVTIYVYCGFIGFYGSLYLYGGFVCFYGSLITVIPDTCDNSYTVYM